MTLNETIDKCSHLETEDRDGYWVCTKCAEALDRIIDYSPKTAYNQSEVVKRRQTEPVFNKLVSRTTLNDYCDFNKKMLPSKNHSKFKRLRRRQKHYWSNDSLERNLMYAESVFRTLKNNFHAPSHIWKTAENIYYITAKKGLIRGRSIDAMVIASIYAGIRCHEQPSTFNELVNNSGHDQEKKAIAKCYRTIINERVLSDLDLKIMPSVPPFNKYCSKLSLSNRVTNKIINEYKNVPAKIKNGRDIKGVLAAVIYQVSIITNNRRTQKEISEVVDVTEVTLRTRHKELYKKSNN